MGGLGRCIITVALQSSRREAMRESLRQNRDRSRADLRQRTARLPPPMAVAGSRHRGRKGHHLLDRQFRDVAAGSGARPAHMDDLWRLHRPEYGIAVAWTADLETRLRP